MRPILYIVIPCYNEEKVLPVTSQMFLDKLDWLIVQGKISHKSKILFVNDGSKDKTWNIICKLADEDIHCRGMSLSRNHGHQKALLAGLMEARDKSDITISIDCDGQDDINAMDKMIDAYLLDGTEIVYGVRSQRKTDTTFKRFTAQSFYRFMNKMGAEVVYNHADYRLMSKRALDELSNFKEVNIFLRGMIPLIGFKSTCISYERHERIAGESHYPLKKMISLAFDGIMSLSVKPMHIIMAFGGIIASISFIGIIWSIFVYIYEKTVAGWTSLICIICLFSGINILSLGIIGEYIGKVYLETKARPNFIISERTYEYIKNENI